MILVIGAGLAGMSAAITLQKSGADVVVIEAADRAGGGGVSGSGRVIESGFGWWFNGVILPREALPYLLLAWTVVMPGGGVIAQVVHDFIHNQLCRFLARLAAFGPGASRVKDIPARP